MDTQLLQTIRALPKIELHRHLEGSVRLSTLLEIAQQHGIEMPEYDIEMLRPFVQMLPGEQRTSAHFLSKFHMLRQFYRSHEVVERITREAVEDAAADNIRYMELRFTPRALCNVTQSPLDEMVALVSDTAVKTGEALGIEVRLIVSMNRHEPVEVGELVTRAAIDHRARGIVGLDLAGDEANYAALPFRTLFRQARQDGLGITIHAGEWAGANSVWDAVGNIGAHRVGHGIHVIQDRAMMQMLVDRKITLEVCPSSNFLSGIVDSLENHPLVHMTRNNLLTTLNTDDPSVCNVTLSEEFALAMDCMGLTLKDVKDYTMRAANAVFRPEAERQALVEQFKAMWAAVDDTDKTSETTQPVVIDKEQTAEADKTVLDDRATFGKAVLLDKEQTAEAEQTVLDDAASTSDEAAL